MNGSPAGRCRPAIFNQLWCLFLVCAWIGVCVQALDISPYTGDVGTFSVVKQPASFGIFTALMYCRCCRAFPRDGHVFRQVHSADNTRVSPVSLNSVHEMPRKPVAGFLTRIDNLFVPAAMLRWQRAAPCHRCLRRHCISLCCLSPVHGIHVTRLLSYCRACSPEKPCNVGLLVSRSVEYGEG